MVLQLLAGCLTAALSAAPAPPAPGLPPQESVQAAAPRAGNPPGEAYYQFVLGRHLESDGDVDGAVKAYRQAAVLDPRSSEIRAELAALYARQNKPDESVEWAEAALALDATSAEAHRVMGLVLASRARLEDDPASAGADAMNVARKAIEHLEAARRGQASPDPGIDLTLGRLYLRTGDDAHAIAALRRLVDQGVGGADVAEMLVQAYEHAGRTAEAVKLLEDGAAEHPQFYASLGELYEKQSRWKEAAGAYERAVARKPRSVELRSRLAVVLLTEGGSAGAARAASLLEDARVQSPADSRVLYLLTQAQRLAGKLDESATTARQLIAIAPAAIAGHYALAQVHDQRQEYRRVIETLEPALEKASRAARPDADLVPPLLTLASAFEEVGSFDRAMATFERVRSLAPGNRNVDVYELGVLVAAKRFPEALERSASLLQSRSGDVRIVRLRADALRGAGRTPEGVSLLKESLAANEDDVTAHLALSEIYAATRQFREAERVLQRAASRFPADLTLGFQLGSVLERDRRYAEAERAFRDVLKKDPLHAGALNYLGYMLADRGQRLDESIALVKRALQVEPYNGAYLDSLGWAYFKANRLDQAEEPLRRAADQRVRDSAVQEHYGDLLFRLGRYDEAVHAWRRALDGDGEQVNAGDLERKIRSASQKAGRQ
jgi:tetratricopeptide (TPR) repeat protein